MALVSTYDQWDALTILWYFSIYLETFAIFPQIHFSTKSKYIGSSLLFYVGLLACYRLFFVVHWTYLYIELKYYDVYSRYLKYDVVAAGTIQFLIYCSYFVWMVPRFKMQYSIIKAESDRIGMQSVIVTSQSNGIWY